MEKRVCEDCGAVYEGTVHTHYCPNCRTERLRKAARERGLHQIGREAFLRRQKERDEKNEQRVEKYL